MGTIDDAVQAQLRNIEQATGRSIDDWVALVDGSGKVRHGEIVSWLKAEHAFSHGNANRVALEAIRRSDGGPVVDPIDAIYAGARAVLRPFHEQVVAVVRSFGDDVEEAPKKAYVSLRRSRQFGTVGPGSAGRLDIGLNLSGEAATGRLEADSGMCTHRVRLSSTEDFDAEVVGWLRKAYESAAPH